MPPPTNKPPSALKDFAKAESMVQLALVLPIACVVGWFLGSLMDRWLHQSWIYVAGIVVGAVAGLVNMWRVASGYMRSND